MMKGPTQVPRARKTNNSNPPLRNRDKPTRKGLVRAGKEYDGSDKSDPAQQENASVPYEILSGKTSQLGSSPFDKRMATVGQLERESLDANIRVSVRLDKLDPRSVRVRLSAPPAQSRSPPTQRLCQSGKCTETDDKASNNNADDDGNELSLPLADIEIDSEYGFFVTPDEIAPRKEATATQTQTTPDSAHNPRKITVWKMHGFPPRSPTTFPASRHNHGANPTPNTGTLRAEDDPEEPDTADYRALSMLVDDSFVFFDFGSLGARETLLQYFHLFDDDSASITTTTTTTTGSNSDNSAGDLNSNGGSAPGTSWTGYSRQPRGVGLDRPKTSVRELVSELDAVGAYITEQWTQWKADNNLLLSVERDVPIRSSLGRLVEISIDQVRAPIVSIRTRLELGHLVDLQTKLGLFGGDELETLPVVPNAPWDLFGRRRFLLGPVNRVSNVRVWRDPALQKHVLTPRSSGGPVPFAVVSCMTGQVTVPFALYDRNSDPSFGGLLVVQQDLTDSSGDDSSGFGGDDDGSDRGYNTHGRRQQQQHSDTLQTRPLPVRHHDPYETPVWNHTVLYSA